MPLLLIVAAVLLSASLPAGAEGPALCREPKDLPPLSFPARWTMLSPAVPWERPWRWYETDSRVWDALAAYYDEAERPAFEVPSAHPELIAAAPPDASAEQALAAVWNDPEAGESELTERGLERLVRRHHADKERFTREAQERFAELYKVYFDLKNAYFDVEFDCQKWRNKPSREQAEVLLSKTLTFEALSDEKLDEKTLKGLERVNPHLAQGLVERRKLVGAWSEGASKAAYGLLSRPLAEPYPIVQ